MFGMTSFAQDLGPIIGIIEHEREPNHTGVIVDARKLCNRPETSLGAKPNAALDTLPPLSRDGDRACLVKGSVRYYTVSGKVFIASCSMPIIGTKYENAPAAARVVENRGRVHLARSLGGII